uniref:BZIP domain-containing protein n=1 Tax=Steinernema glaseri TaxID=37863 RepID=A0A1I8A7K7_9BILA
MGSLELAEEFTIDQPLEQDKELPKTPKKVHFADNLIATPTPFRPGPVSPLGRERDCQQPSEEKSTFIFNHVPVAVPVPYENPPRKGCGDLAKVDNKKDLKKRKVKQQRREADQIRRKRKKAAAVGTHVVAFADDDTLADLASTLNMPVINYSVVLSL